MRNTRVSRPRARRRDGTAWPYVARLALLLASLGPLLAQQQQQRQVETVLNCLRQPDGDRLAAPVLRLVKPDDRAAVATAVVRSLNQEPGDVLVDRLLAAATAAPAFGVVLLDVAPKLVDPGMASEPRHFRLLEEVLPFATSEQVQRVLDDLRRAAPRRAPQSPFTGRRLDCAFRYELRAAELSSPTAEALAERVYRFCQHRDYAFHGCRLVDADVRFVAVEARLLADHDRDDGTIPAAVEREVRRSLELAEPMSEWPTDPLLAQAWLLSRQEPYSRPGRWGLLGTIGRADALQRGAALQQLLLVPPRAAERRLVFLLAQQLQHESPATVRAFLAWAASGSEAEQMRWPVQRVAAGWAPELQVAALAAFGRFRSPRDEVVFAFSGSQPVNLSLGPDLAIEWLGRRLQRLVESLRHLPLVSIAESEAAARLQVLYGDWHDLAAVESPAVLATRLDHHLANNTGRASGLLPRLLRHCLTATGGDPALARAVGLAVLSSSRSIDFPGESVPTWAGVGLPEGSRIVVGGDAAAWQELAAIAGETPFAFGMAPTPPDWAAAVRFAARDRSQALSLDEVRALGSLWSETGALVRVHEQGRLLFEPVAAQTVGDRFACTSFVLTPVRTGGG